MRTPPGLFDEGEGIAEVWRAPLQLTLGNDAVDAIRGSLERGLAHIAFWEPVARKADFGA